MIKNEDIEQEKARLEAELQELDLRAAAAKAASQRDSSGWTSEDLHLLYYGLASLAAVVTGGTIAHNVQQRRVALKEYKNNPEFSDIHDRGARLALQIMRQQYASADEILAASFGGDWPPKGLNIVLDNPQRIDVRSIVETVENEKNLTPDQLRRAPDTPLANAALNGDRVIGVNEYGLLDKHKKHGYSRINSALGHEGVHILQGDHEYRALDAYGLSNATVEKPDFSPVQGFYTDSGTEDGLKVGFFDQYVIPGSEDGDKHFKYLTEGVEVQARIHEVLMAGYKEWGQLPINKEQLITALHDAGLNIPDDVKRAFENSETLNETSKVFSGLNRPQFSSVMDINQIVSRLSGADNAKFWNTLVPEMYADLIEMYGDKEGRARFDLGTNARYEHRKEGIASRYIDAVYKEYSDIDKISRGTVFAQEILSRDALHSKAEAMIAEGRIADLRSEIDALKIKGESRVNFWQSVDFDDWGKGLHEQFERLYQAGGKDAVTEAISIRNTNQLIDLRNTGGISSAVNQDGKIVLIIQKDQVGHSNFMGMRDVLEANGFSYENINPYDHDGHIEIHDPDNRIHDLKRITDGPVLALMKSPEATPIESKALAAEQPALDMASNLKNEPSPDNAKNTIVATQAAYEEAVNTGNTDASRMVPVPENYNGPLVATYDEYVQAVEARDPIADRMSSADSFTPEPARLPSDNAKNINSNNGDGTAKPLPSGGTPDVIQARMSAGGSAAGLAMGAIGLKNAIAAGDSTGIAVSGVDVVVSSVDLGMDAATAAGRSASHILHGVVSKANILVTVADGVYQVSKEEGLENKTARGAAVAVTTTTALAVGGTAATIGATGLAAGAATIAAPIVAAVAVGMVGDAAVDAYKITGALEDSIAKQEKAVKTEGHTEETGAPSLLNYRHLRWYAKAEDDSLNGAEGLSRQEIAAQVTAHDYSKDPAALDQMEAGLRTKIAEYDQTIEENDSWVNDSVRFFWADDEIDAKRMAQIDRAPYVAALNELEMYREELEAYKPKQAVYIQNQPSEAPPKVTALVADVTEKNEEVQRVNIELTSNSKLNEWQNLQEAGALTTVKLGVSCLRDSGWNPTQNNTATVKTNDTIWSMTKEHFDLKDNIEIAEKVKEVLKINGVNEEQARNIQPGQKIIFEHEDSAANDAIFDKICNPQNVAP